MYDTVFESTWLWDVLAFAAILVMVKLHWGIMNYFCPVEADF